MASKTEIQNVIDSTDIVSLVSEYVKLDKQGKNYKGLCPFHHEDTPSFIVSPEKKYAKCFGCGNGGNPIDFLIKIENIDFNTALHKLAKKNGIKLSDSGFKEKANPLMKYYQIMNTSLAFYQKYLENTKEGLEALEYMHKRGLDDETIRMFGIGLAPSNHDSLYQVLKDAGYLELDMIDVALVDKGQFGYYDLFTKRIMFPIKNEIGNVIGYSGRIFNNTDKNQPKYVNSRETILFKKHDVLYNLNLAKSEIQKKKRVILHEGQMDVIASFRSGLKEAICTMGTALSIDQINVLKKYTNHAIICYDNDKAGINASLKAIELFQKAGFLVHLVLLPEGIKDADEFVLSKGSEEYVKYFESNIVDSYTYIFNQAFINKNLNDSEAVLQIKNQIFEMIYISKTKTNEELYLNKLSEKLNCSFDAIYSDYVSYCNINHREKTVEEYNENNYNYFENYSPKNIKKETFLSPCEMRLFMYARASKEKALFIDRMLTDRIEAMSSSAQRLWISLINTYYENFDEFEEGKFVKILDTENFQYYCKIVELLSKDKVPYSDEDLNDCLEKLKRNKIDIDNDELNDRIKRTDDISKRVLSVEMKFKNIKKKEKLVEQTRRK